MQKRLPKRLTAFLLLAVMGLSLFSCGKKDDPKGDTSDDAQKTENLTETEAEVKRLYGDRDYGGKEFRILSAEPGSLWYGNISDTANEVWFETSSSDYLERGVYERNKKTQDLLNVTIKPVWEASWDDVSQRLSSDVNSGVDEYDAAIMNLAETMGAARIGNLLSFNEFESFDSTHSWWNEKFMKEIAIFNTDIYAVSGAININDDAATSTMIFNKTMLEKYNATVPYQEVFDGTWTVEALMERARAATNDTSGDTRMNENDDWGIGTWGSGILMGVSGFGYGIAQLNEEGVPTLTIGSEETVEMSRYWFETVSASGCLYDSVTTGNGAFEPLFLNGQVAFALTNMSHLFTLRDMEDEYGILPLPKYNEAQADYEGSINTAFFTAFALPKSCTDPDMAVTCLEVMSGYAVDTLDASLHEIVFETKLARDEESRQILKLVQDTISFDWGYIGNWHNITPAFDIRPRMQFTLASNLAAVLESAQEGLDELIADFDDLRYR